MPLWWGIDNHQVMMHDAWISSISLGRKKKGNDLELYISYLCTCVGFNSLNACYYSRTKTFVAHGLSPLTPTGVKGQPSWCVRQQRKDPFPLLGRLSCDGSPLERPQKKVVFNKWCDVFRIEAWKLVCSAMCVSRCASLRDKLRLMTYGASLPRCAMLCNVPFDSKSGSDEL